MQTNDKEEQEERREVMHGAHQLLEGLDALERPHGLEQLRRQATALPTTHVLPTLRHNHNPAAWCCLVLILQ